MKRTRRFLVCSMIVPCLATMVGCGSSEQMAPVKGRLTAAGKPLGDVQVQFIPDTEQGGQGPRSVGTTDKEGFYHLTTDDGRPGAVVGPHLIVLSDLSKVDPDAVRMPRSPKDTSRAAPALPKAGEPPPPAAPALRFAKEFSSSARTSLKKTVAEGDQTIDLEVPAPPPPPGAETGP
jgi:hypothetical protein